MPVLTAPPVELTVAYIAEMQRLGEMVGAALREAFDNLSGYDRAQLEEWFGVAKPLTGAGAAEAVDLTSAYLAELTGKAPAAVDLAELTTALDGPFLRHWHDLKEGMPWDQSRDAGASQAEMLGPDVTSDAGAARMARPGVKTLGFRRVLTPTACEWCQVVATQTYASADSASFGHHNCQCTVVAITDAGDPALAINKDRLKELRGSGAVQRATDARERSRDRQGARPRR